MNCAKSDRRLVLLRENLGAKARVRAGRLRTANLVVDLSPDRANEADVTTHSATDLRSTSSTRHARDAGRHHVVGRARAARHVREVALVLASDDRRVACIALSGTAAETDARSATLVSAKTVATGRQKSSGDAKSAKSDTPNGKRATTSAMESDAARDRQLDRPLKRARSPDRPTAMTSTTSAPNSRRSRRATTRCP